MFAALPSDLGRDQMLSFDSVWLWPVLLIAVVFVAYLCFDGWQMYRRKKRLEELRRRAREDGD